MKLMYSHELPLWMKLLGIWRINIDSIEFKWGYFAPRAGLEFIINRGTYFDQRYAISFAFGWGRFMIYTPLKTRLKEGCDMPRYGFAIHNDTFWIYVGGKYEDGQCNDQWITWDLPFFSYVFDGHWIRDKSFNWVKMGEYMSAWEYRKDNAYTEVHRYTYRLNSGMVQETTATCTLEKRLWHRKWFPFLKRRSHVIDIEFSDEVGERTGTWKGGTLGCTYQIQRNETIADCLQRMQRERKF